VHAIRRKAFNSIQWCSLNVYVLSLSLLTPAEADQTRGLLNEVEAKMHRLTEKLGEMQGALLFLLLHDRL
jgi:hypothetical protein